MGNDWKYTPLIKYHINVVIWYIIELDRLIDTKQGMKLQSLADESIVVVGEDLKFFKFYIIEIKVLLYG